MKLVKSFGILIEGYRGRAVNRADRSTPHVKIWDTAGRVCVKCFGMLVEDTGGGGAQSALSIG
jgi:hypothetical protein